MTNPSYETLRSNLFANLAGSTIGTEEYSNALKQLETLNKAESAQLLPEPPEETGAKAWFEKHSESLLRIGGTFGTVVLIGFVETKFDVIFRSKASKYL